MSDKHKTRVRHSPHRLATPATIAALLFISASPALATVYGEPNGNDHPSVGSIVVNVLGLGLFQWCSGTLIAEHAFLTASHCTAPLDELAAEYPGLEVLVTFDPTIIENGTWFTNPDYSGFQGQSGASDPGDVAVILLDEAPGITPARLSPAGMLDELKQTHRLKDTRFTAVGYGTVRETNRTGLQGILANLDRNRAEQGFNSLTPAWLTLPMNITTGNGGTCYGDSGGPHFIHLDGVETDIVVSITSWLRKRA